MNALIRELKNVNQINSLTKLLDTDESNQIYLVNYKKNGKKYHSEFTILGTLRAGKRSEYKVILLNDGKFKCNCKDFKFNSSDRVCKHICFLMCRVAKMYSKNFFTTHILTKEEFKKFTEIEFTIKNIENDFAPVESKAGEDCSICFDKLSLEAIIACPDCHNNIHKRCMEVWLEKNKTCLFCRSTSWGSYIKISR
jgi:hypothetical protein